MNDKKYYKLGLNIRSLREAYGETQEDLFYAITNDSEDIKYSGGKISNYELGVRIPNREHLLRIAKHYNVTVDELLNSDFSDLDCFNFDVHIGDKNAENNLVGFFPVFKSEKSMENESFAKACELQKNNISIILDDNIDDIEEYGNKFAKLYRIAEKQGVFEAYVNELSWYMFLLLSINIYTSNLEQLFENKKEKDIKAVDFLKAVNLKSEDVDVEDEELNEIKKDLRKQYLGRVIYLVKKLKTDTAFVDLGDFYLALLYYFDIIRKDNTTATNRNIGVEMLYIFSKLGNKYADNLFNTINELYLHTT